MNENKSVVIAVGGNALILDKTLAAPRDQVKAANKAMARIADIVADGWNVVVTHGNGPQIGFMLRRVEMAYPTLPPVELDILGADTQGATGYMFTRALRDEFAARGSGPEVAALVTMTVVDEHDPAFQNPTKPIGSFMSEEEAKQHATADQWAVVEDSGRGWRRVVPSPLPKRIVEIDVLRTLIAAGVVVVACGGGGIPVIEANGALTGIEAVIDKDHASALLANQLGADVLVISTAVDSVALNFGTPDQESLGVVSIAEMKKHLAAGQFGKGSMEPKVEAAIAFVERGGQRAIITSLVKMADALNGNAGTVIIN